MAEKKTEWEKVHEGTMPKRGRRTGKKTNLILTWVNTRPQ